MTRWRSVARSLKHLRIDDSGATAAEYAILASLIALALVVSVRAFGISLQQPFGTLSQTFTSRN